MSAAPHPLIPYESRPTEMLQRQLLANRKAARTWIVDERGNKRRNFSHDRTYRRFFVAEIVVMRGELRSRGVRRIRP